MGVSIEMRPGTIMRSKGDVIRITPGLRSRGAAALRRYFGESPMEIDTDHIALLEMLAQGAAVYVHDEDNMFLKIKMGVEGHGCVVVKLEY